MNIQKKAKIDSQIDRITNKPGSKISSDDILVLLILEQNNLIRELLELNKQQSAQAADNKPDVQPTKKRTLWQRIIGKPAQ